MGLGKKQFSRLTVLTMIIKALVTETICMILKCEK